MGLRIVFVGFLLTALIVVFWVFWGKPLYAQGVGVGGFLTQGEEVAEGTLSCTFSLYDSEEATEPLCSDTQDIDLNGGTFYTGIDCLSAEELPDNLFMAVQCGGEDLLPRVAFNYVPYALRAKVADLALSVDSSLCGSGISCLGNVLTLDTTSSQTWTGAQTFSNASVPTGGTFALSGNMTASGATISPSEVALLDGKTTLVDIDDAHVLLPTHLALVTGDALSDEECVTYEASEGRFEIQACSAGGAAAVTDDSLDFAKFEDTLDLDAATEINLGTSNLTIDLDSTGDFIIADGGVATHIFRDNGFVGIGTASPGQTLAVAGTLGILEGGVSPSYYTIFQGGDQSADVTYTLPTAAPTAAGQVLSSALSGVMSWATVDTSTTNEAPTSATYITQTADATLTSEQALSTLTSGYMKVTTGTGVVSSQATPIPVADGGTGATVFTANGVIYGNAGNALASTAAGTDGQVFLGQLGAAPAFGTMSGDAGISNTGTLTIAGNAVALGTDTTNNYVATIAAEAGGEVSVTGSGTESAAVTLDVGANSIDFAEMEDILDLDATTKINLGSTNLTIDLDSTGDFIIADGGVATHIFQDNGRVGIGDTTPDGTLGVTTTTAAESSLVIARATNPPTVDIASISNAGQAVNSSNNVDLLQLAFEGGGTGITAELNALNISHTITAGSASTRQSRGAKVTLTDNSGDAAGTAVGMSVEIGDGSTNATDTILVLANNDTGGTTTDAIQIVNTAGTITNDIKLQNSETISNATDGDISFGGANLVNQKRKVQAKTSNYTVTTSDSGSVFTNEGATGVVTFTLPAAAAGLQYTFAVQVTQQAIINPNGTNRILALTDVDGDAIMSATAGYTVTLTAINSTQWVATCREGTWTDVN